MTDVMLSSAIFPSLKTKPSTMDIEHVRTTARSLANDIVISFKIDEDPPRHVRAGVVRTMRRVVRQLLQRHVFMFSGMAKKLNITDENSYTTFVHVVDEMLTDNRLNWGRLVTVYAFGAALASHCADNNMARTKLANYLGDYVANNMGDWIHENGGWAAFEEYFPERKSVEQHIWNGFLITAVGLGALATMVAVN